MHAQFLGRGLSALFFASTLQAASFSHNQTVFQCLDAHRVTYLTPSSADWAAYQAPYNLRLAWTPKVIAVPADDAEVGAAVRCAAAANLKVQAKGGGHSYASYSSGGQDGSFIIELEKFDDISLDESTSVVKIGAGQRLGNIATAIFDQGHRAMPHGTCSGVGIAGHALHGGYGYDSRKWGLALDHIVGLDVVLADGRCVYTDATHLPDLFYAMRGAGESFGIATHFYMSTEEAPASVLWFTATISSSLTHPIVAAKGFEALQNWTLTSPDLTPNITFGTFADSGGFFSLRGWCMDCDPTVFANNVLPAMASGFPGAELAVQELGWIDALVVLADPDALSQPLGHLYTKHDTFYAKSVVTREDAPLTPASWLSYTTWMAAHQGVGPWFSINNLYGGPGSLINAVSPEESAYSDRDSLWVFQNYGYTANGLPPWNPLINDLIDSLNDAITVPQPDGDFSAYLNYIDPDLTAEEAHEEYYEEATYDKLVALKIKYDPKQVFWNPQAIGTSV